MPIGIIPLHYCDLTEHAPRSAPLRRTAGHAAPARGGHAGCPGDHERGPDNLDALINLGVIAAQQKDYVTAVKAFSYGLRRAPLLPVLNENMRFLMHQTDARSVAASFVRDAGRG